MSNAIKKINASLDGDSAVQANILEVSLGLSKNLSKKEIDSEMVKLGLDSLSYVIGECKVKTGKKFPTHKDIENFLISKDGQLSLM